MTQLTRSYLLRYGFAILTVALAQVITSLIEPVRSQTPFAIFFAAVMLSAWYGGHGPGLLATALAALSSALFVLPPAFSLAVGLEEGFKIVVFLVVALLISSLASSRRLANVALRESEERLSTILKSIGDAVIATDKEGRVTFMNPVAQSLTGWELAEARGKTLPEVFKIINEETGAEAENPAVKVIREGRIVGLANHTSLIAKDGTVRPIDNSGAPIHDMDGNLLGIVLIFHDITERRLAEDAHSKFISIIEHSEDAILGKTLEGIITIWNAGAERLYGYSAEEMIGRPVSMLVPPDRSNDVPQILEKIKRGEPIEHYETIRRKKDGSLVNISLSVSPIRNAAGVTTGASVIARDITERKEAEAERAELMEREHAARIEAENANRAKDEFLATLSHELRTPLTAMLGWTRMLRMKELNEATTAHALETIERNVKVQTQLIEDILDVSRIVTGKLRLNARPVDLAPIIEAVIDSVRPAANAKAIEIQKTLSASAGLVSGDSDRLQQVIWNLISNAIKFTQRGGHVHVKLRRNGSAVEISVQDTGAGIRPEFLPHVFERFRQADSSTTRAHGGLGLGLAIVRHFVELHGGTVYAESQGEGQGATFIVNLPLIAVAAQSKHGEHVHSATGAGGLPDGAHILNGLRILVVEDEDDARVLLTAVLEGGGASVSTVVSVSEALASIENQRPDVLVSDIGLPGENGYTLIRKLREFEAGDGELPAIALTAYASEEDRQVALRSGFQIHLAKPVDPVELIASVAHLAGRNDKE